MTVKLLYYEPFNSGLRALGMNSCLMEETERLESGVIMSHYCC